MVKFSVQTFSGSSKCRSARESEIVDIFWGPKGKSIPKHEELQDGLASRFSSPISADLDGDGKADYTTIGFMSMPAFEESASNDTLMIGIESEGKRLELANKPQGSVRVCFEKNGRIHREGVEGIVISSGGESGGILMMTKDSSNKPIEQLMDIYAADFNNDKLTDILIVLKNGINVLFVNKGE